MIKINLLPQKRAKRAGSAKSEPSSKQLFVGLGALAAVGALVFILVDKPKRDRLNELRDANAELGKSIAERRRTDRLPQPRSPRRTRSSKRRRSTG